jgi:thiol-disulfide isomerase/thioredoxin
MDPQPPLDTIARGRSRNGGLVVGALLGLGILGVLWAGIDEARRLRPQTAGQDAPEARFQRFGGGSVSLSSLRGKVVLVDFWATFCPPCVEEMPVLVKLAREYVPRGVVFVAPSLDDPQRARVEVGVFIDGKVPGLAPYAAFADEASANAFGVRALPTLVIIDRAGKVASTYIGSASERQWRDRIEAALRGS